MDLLLTGKTAFISGSSQGIGYAIAECLAKEGVHIILNGRDAARVAQAEATLRVQYPEITIQALVADVANDSEISTLLASVGEIDILINNVGIFEQRSFSESGSDDWLHNFNVNVMTGVKLSQQLLPGMIHRNWGRIIFIGSEFALSVASNSIQYGVTKSAVSALGNGLSKLTKGTAVTVNTILAGATYSEGVADTIKYFSTIQNLPEEEVKDIFFKKANPDSLLERFIEPLEIAALATFLASPLSLAINGTAIRADAGSLRIV
ncbi:SDR family oxidoreductase [Sphingobacteriaceae bacterium WQ 2009]|uniref:SDR family oxidoreductase n=1 Tax=Rhinopithecimicrobium faecis TaxID=2820698 RepID=A0A8T4HCE3_9SPHI|nr:SDR family oxidoreductase [Sphingobacteriaceae bacterium WQ 2009]